MQASQKIFHFYVIVTPGSLKFLEFALWSLHVRHDINIILVPNGLSVKENTNLKLFCNQIHCEYQSLETSHVLSHGAALNLLIKKHTKALFCFCDSDIISLDPIANDINIGDNLKAISSCDAMFWDNQKVEGVLGRCNRWPDGSINLSSFFCIYHTETLKSLINKYKVDFDNKRFNQVNSNKIRQTLHKKGIDSKSRKLDTGKLITAALEADNHQFSHIEIPSLLHIGGMSSWMLNGDKKLIHENYHLTDKDLYELADESSWLFNQNAYRDENNKNFYLRRQQRLAAARYCFQLISHYVDNTPKPIYSLSDANLISKINHIEDIILQYQAEVS